ncbi:hypothetical protein N480_18615 [Pseudoalteromonas luteoviolacea S2607]|uniref:YbaN family protein n=1 Tax=Pseudoalteromonas luteoviolacea TaxID=43657 RepID=UPI0007B05D73|nr:YbaN family protein [Pseudoalteromonas luteoviolacea]KZN36005.1 hypothetical protein N480_18615 [Pseudoalteromonas luteoviolacea S2607]
MPHNLKRTAVKYSYLLGGFFSLGLAFIGAILPVMPTTVFLIIALWCFSQSSDKLENWLLTHPKFGKTLSNWQTRRIVPKKAKYFAAISMGVSLVISGMTLSFGWLQVALLILFAFICNYLFAKPSEEGEHANRSREKQLNMILILMTIVVALIWGVTH